jgi:formyl-CoA transferase
VFARLAAAMGTPELAQDAKYATHGTRGANQRELDELIENWTRTRSTRAGARLDEHARVPAGLIYRAPEMLADPHFRAREAIVTVPHPDFGELRMQNVAPKLSETPGSVRSPSPQMGEHNDEIYLQLLGLEQARYAELKARRII